VKYAGFPNITSMRISVKISEAKIEEYPGRKVSTLLDPSTVGSSDFVMGVITYFPGCAVEPHAHDDQEGIYVLSGRGTARIGSESVELEPGVAIYIPKGVTHSVSNHFNEPLHAVLAHAPVCGPR